MYAVIRTGGKQYRVAPEDVIKIEKISGDVGEAVEFAEVLMVGGEGEPEVGAPLIEGASVAGEVVEQGRGAKIIVFKKKRRKNYRRKHGHRQDLTTVRITEILTGGKKPSKAKAAKPKPKKTEEKPKAEKAAPKKAEKKEPEAKAKTAKKTEDKAELTPLFKAPKGKADDLKKISGVGPVIEKKLNALGITTYEQVASFTKEEIAKVDEVLNFKGRIERDDWVKQAKTLMSESDK